MNIKYKQLLVKFKETWNDHATAIVGGLLLGTIAAMANHTSSGNYEAHFFQQRYAQETKAPTIVLRPITLGTPRDLATNMTDETLRAAAADESSIEASSIVSSESSVDVPAFSSSIPFSFSSSITPSSRGPQSSIMSESESASSFSSTAAQSSDGVGSFSPSSNSSNSPISLNSFPAFDHASQPVFSVPNWGAMRTPAEWNRRFKQMTQSDFVPIPAYNMSVLTTPMDDLTSPITAQTIPLITAKLYYSTRYYGTYDLDAGEFTGTHPGVDLKLAQGTPIGAIAGGRVNVVSKEGGLGTHVIIEHRLKDGSTYYSIYGHLDAAYVHVGDDIKPGDTIGIVGMTGNTTAPHLHLQVDVGQPGERSHDPYVAYSLPSPAEASVHTINPIVFIGKYRKGE